MIAEEVLLPRKLEHAVGELDLVTRAAFLDLENVEDVGLQDVAAVDVEVGRRGAFRRLLYHLGDLEPVVDLGTLADDAILVRLRRIAFLHADDVAAAVLVKFHHLAHAAFFRLHDHVWQEQREGLVADDVAGAPDRMSEAHGNLLARVADLAGFRLDALQHFELLRLSALLESLVEFELDVEMVFDHRLVAPGDEDEMLDTRLACLVHHILDDGPVDDRDHLLGDGLGGRQEAGAQSRDREHCLAHFLHGSAHPFEIVFNMRRDIFTPKLTNIQHDALAVKISVRGEALR